MNNQSTIRTRRHVALPAGILGLLAVACCCWAGRAPAYAQSAADQGEFYETKVRPLLVQHCLKCHSGQGKKTKAELNLDDRDGWLRGGESGPAVVPGHPEKSLLIEAISYHNDNLKMPPTGKLAAWQIELLKEWVRRGAPGPQGTTPAKVAAAIDIAKGRQFWSFRPLAVTAAPSVQDSAWPLTPIDRFLLARLEGAGLAPVADADPETLLRRVYFDLVGLPPTPAELDAFLAECATAGAKAGGPRVPSLALEKVVDRLLASPQFGAKWARHWLDLARYADTNGSDENYPYADAWRYRNWVIDAFNHDMPLDQFLTAQVAGDLLDAPTQAQRDANIIATGFLMLGPKTIAQYDRLLLKMDVVDEQIDLVGRAVLGMTVGCARCHDHKFDPIPTADYYALAGIFASTQSLDGPKRNAKDVHTDWMRRGLGADGDARLLAYKAKQFDALKAELKWYDLKTKVAKLQKQLAGKPPGERAALEPLEHDLAAAAAAKATYDALLPPTAMAVRDTAYPADERICIRGDIYNRGPLVPRGFLQVAAFDGQPAVNAKQSGRLELARWLTSPKNPLTARVFVNRVWHHLFGAGLVRTVDNFGNRGEPPTHPELLDYLAERFVAQGWSTKQLIRQIVTSRAYRLGTRPDPRALAVDPENRLLWRMNRRRLTPEQMRDAILLVSARLDSSPGGAVTAHLPHQSINGLPPLTLADRRSVYLPVIRNQLLDLFEVFDFATPTTPTGDRPTTTVAPQALYMMNSPFIRQASQDTARVLLKEHPEAGVHELARLAFKKIANRSPTESELQPLVRYLEARLAAAGPDARATALPDALGGACHALFASTWFQYLD
jgi:hypothetical protein